MKRLSYLVLLVFLACSLSVCALQPGTDDLMTIANDVVDLLLKGDYSRVERNFSADMKTAMPEEKLQENWEALVALVGPYQKGLGAKSKSVEQDGQQRDAIAVRLQFDYSQVEVMIGFNTTKRITSLDFTLVDNPPSKYTIDPALVAMANDFVSSVNQGDFTSPVKYFDDSLKATLSASALQDRWKSLVAEKGALKKRIGVWLETPEQEGQTTVGLFVTCEFEKSTIDVQLSLDSQGRITSVHFIPVEPAPRNPLGVFLLVRPTAPDPKLVATADEFLGQLAKADYARAATYTTDTAVETYRKLWEKAVAEAGQFRRRTRVRAGASSPGLNKFVGVFLTCEFENSTRTFHALFNGKNQIRGFLRLSDDSAAQVEACPYAEAITDLLAKGDYAAVVRTFDEKMKSALPESKLKETWDSILAESGPFKRRVSSYGLAIPPYDVGLVMCEFEKGAFEVQASFNRFRQVSGLFIRPIKGASTPK